LEAFLAGNSTGPFGSKARFRLVTASPGNRNELKGSGTYGFIMIKTPNVSKRLICSAWIWVLPCATWKEKI